jgi:hypothetical protein
MPTNHAWTPMVKTFGLKSIPQKMGHQFNPPGPGFSILSLMETLCQALAIIPQIIMSF